MEMKCQLRTLVIGVYIYLPCQRDRQDFDKSRVRRASSFFLNLNFLNRFYNLGLKNISPHLLCIQIVISISPPYTGEFQTSSV